jgi:hypothetical protein
MIILIKRYAVTHLTGYKIIHKSHSSPGIFKRYGTNIPKMMAIIILIIRLMKKAAGFQSLISNLH